MSAPIIEKILREREGEILRKFLRSTHTVDQQIKEILREKGIIEELVKGFIERCIEERCIEKRDFKEAEKFLPFLEEEGTREKYRKLIDEGRKIEDFLRR